ncbi:MAG TPA: DUF3152 domain-containing protein [Actinomycetes bacterium]|nr:DUF3152 domain-containing protein [Actinomycetes bacterium]
MKWTTFFHRMGPVVAVSLLVTFVSVPAHAGGPQPVEDVQATPGHRQVDLSWSLPTGGTGVGTVVRRNDGTGLPPATPTDGIAVYDGPGVRVVDKGLTNGVTYSYRLWTKDAGSSYSTPVDITATPVERVTAKAQLSVDKKRLRYGQQVTLKARLVESSGGAGIGGERLELQSRRGGSDNWRQVEADQTAVGGRVSWSLRPETNSEFRVVHEATPFTGRALSSKRQVQVTPQITAHLGKTWARQSGSAVVRGKVRPSFRGDSAVLQRRVDGHWHRVTSDRQNAAGEYALRIGHWAARGEYNYRVIAPATAKHRQASSQRLSLDVVRVVTYQIETRGHIVASMDKFRDRVAEIYADKRGWSRAFVHFKRIKRGADFSGVLSQARLVASFAPICDTYYSCRVGRYVVINQDRWRFGTPYFLATGATMAEYRAMVIDHETGHWFGLGHATCSKRGAPAPVMMQQSKGLHGCEPNPWPLPGEIARVR